MISHIRQLVKERDQYLQVTLMNMLQHIKNNLGINLIHRYTLKKIIACGLRKLNQISDSDIYTVEILKKI